MRVAVEGGASVVELRADCSCSCRGTSTTSLLEMVNAFYGGL